MPEKLRGQPVFGWIPAFALMALGVFLVGAAFAVLFKPASPGREASADTVHEYNLEIVPKDIDYGNGAVWHAWTFNGSVPGPALRVKADEVLRVRVVNRHDMTHSFHAHLDGYSFAHDGSQANMVLGHGSGGVLKPGAEYTWEFRPRTPGIYYYHTHYADKGVTGAQAEAQGLYGAIIVEDPTEEAMREEVLFMGEIGHKTEGKVTPFVMNGMGVPGGEGALESIHREGGYQALAAQFNRTIPAFNVRVNEPFKLHVINAGNVEHSLYIHSASVTSLGVLGGRQWPARVVPLVQGAADTLLVKFEQPGMWLFHCHVPIHADLGMVGLFIVE